MIKKHAIFVIRSLTNGGAERVVANLASLLTNERVQCHIITLEHVIELDIDKTIPIHTYLPSIAKHLPRSLKAKRMAKEFDNFVEDHLKLKPDLIFSNLYSSDFFLKYSRHETTFILHSPVFNVKLSMFSSRKQKRRTTRMKKLYRGENCIAVSKGVEDDFRHILPNSSVTCIYNPVMKNFITEKANSTEPESPDSYLVHVGRLNPQKRHDLLIEAYYKSGIKTPLLLLGKGELEPNIKKQIEDLKLDQQVILLGYNENPYSYIKGAKGLILSSEFEGLGMVLLEALILETPAISFDCPYGPSEILQKKCLATHMDTNDLAKKIKALDLTPEKFISPVPPKFDDQFIANAYHTLIKNLSLNHEYT